jgi:hypothetical protein
MGMVCQQALKARLEIRFGVALWRAYLLAPSALKITASLSYNPKSGKNPPNNKRGPVYKGVVFPGLKSLTLSTATGYNGRDLLASYLLYNCVLLRNSPPKIWRGALAAPIGAASDSRRRLPPEAISAKSTNKNQIPKGSSYGSH